MEKLLYTILIAALTTLTACSQEPAPPTTTTPKTEVSPTANTPSTLTFEVTAEHPHSPTDFTQGLEVAAPNTLIESTGLRGRSQVMIYKIGEAPLKTIALPATDFGEGITSIPGETPADPKRFLQVTWQEGRGYIYGENLKVIDTFAYEGEGWGVCSDTQKGVFYRSDGTATLHVHSLKTYEEVGTIPVTYKGAPLLEVNELECVEGKIWANVWKSENIFVLGASTGRVEKIFDGSSLIKRAEEVNGKPLPPGGVLNGIAYDAESEIWYLTGKLWPVIFSGKFS